MTAKRRIAVPVAAAALVLRAASGGEAPRPGGASARMPRERLHVYLLIGQSNMAGRAPIARGLEAPIPRCFLLNSNDAWEPAADPLNRHSTVRKGLGMQRLGPGRGFALRMLEALPDASLGLVVNAKGGTTLREWAKGARLYEEAVRRSRVAARTGTLKGVLWHQGESDAGDPRYVERLARLIADLRRDLGEPGLPFVAGEIFGAPKKAAFNDRLARLPAEVPRTGVASAKGLAAFDGTHFDAPSQLALGRRYADEMLRLQGAGGAAEGGRKVADSGLDFDGRISREVLERYLARAITMQDLLTREREAEDNIRMLGHIGARFAGRVVYRWGGEGDLARILPRAREIAKRIHAVEPRMILQAAEFEIVSEEVGRVRVPERVFREFGLAAEDRAFRYEEMLFPDGQWRDHWGKGRSVPDMTRLETKMWFWHLAAEYVDIGCEAIHFGQVALIGARDGGMEHWWDMLSRVRRYAAAHARRHMVICDAHVPTGGRHHGGDALLFDFHSFPLRIEEVHGRPQEGVLEVGHTDSIYGRSKGGLTPGGWRCESLPYLVEVDNWGRSGREGREIEECWIWGYDEIGWFAHQSEDYRNRWLRYAWDWVREHDPNGFLQMPGSRCLAVPIDGRIWWYWANRPSAAVPDGFSQEDAIRDIWAGDEANR